jgi:hypothetical protein
VKIMTRFMSATLFAIAVVLGSVVVAPDEMAIDWFTIDAGGGTSENAGGTLKLHGTIAQSDAGTLSSTSFTLAGGFRIRFATPDMDGDGDVDLDDHAEFAPCETGPGGSVPSGCETADIDLDNDIDLKDFATLQRAFTGDL